MKNKFSFFKRTPLGCSKRLLPFFGIITLSLFSCQQEDVSSDDEIEYSEDIYDLKEYLVERHPPVVRNGFGMDMYHEGNSGLDTVYFSTDLPAYHPNNCTSTGTDTYYEYEGEEYKFEYDLLFYNEYAYAQNYAGDYVYTGYPVIFMYTDPEDDSNSTHACMVGQGIDCFEAFTYDSLFTYVDSLASDPEICLDDYRTEVESDNVEGSILLKSTIGSVYSSLVIGNKFRPNIGGVFDMDDASYEDQINYQPVFLIQTREGLYAKFMVTRFKGTGSDTQKLTLQWEDLEED